MCFRFNNNCQSPASFARQAAGDGVNGVKASSSSGVGWIRTGEGDSCSRLGDKSSSGEQSLNKTHTCLHESILTYLHFPDTVVSKVTIPRLQPSDQSSRISPNKNTKVRNNNDQRS